MATSAILSALLSLLAGIGIFLIACQMMSSNLESASSEKLKQLFSKASKSKLLGVGIGTLGTAAIQSSGATTVMTIGFVNAGIISLTQAATIIYGANIGTTVTAQIVALGMFGSGGVSTSVIFSAFAGIGALLMLFCKKSSWKTAGGILTGFGMLFVGLSLMSGSMSEFAALDGVKTFLASIGNPILLVLLGAIFTAIIQSSSVMTSIALAMVVTGLIKLDQGIFLTMGSNIGSCVVAILASITSSKNAKRTALIHLIFNCSGVVFFMIAGWLLGLFSAHRITYGNLFETMFPGAPQTQLAMFHTFFNVITVILILPLTNALVKLVTTLIPDSQESSEEDVPHLHYVNVNMLKTPPLAVELTKKEILRMASLAIDNFNRALRIITTMEFSEKEQFQKTEKELNFLNSALVNYVVMLSECKGISEHDHIYLATTYRTIRDLERIGDYAENILEYSEAMAKDGQGFSEDALEEIGRMQALVSELYNLAIEAYTEENLNALDQANAVEERIDDCTKEMEDNHIKRLSKGVCSPEVGAQYLSLSSNAERIADHLINVAKSIRSLKAQAAA
ncbi:MAG: Na/Pi cotransporter family protein [Candidatus Cryptobacteroides sp.]|nr:Na/Pi cotransporter family protein [Bacteroidales bacterium]MDY2878077.1 Na/Pi cotransporter family protein [Candidatus Cryptobacteroides sp.]